MKNLFLFLVLFSIFENSYSQKNAYKIDSTFKFYFFVFEMETTNCCPREKYSEYYDTIVIKNKNDTVYLNKYLGEAAEFIQKISKIKSPRSNYEVLGYFNLTVSPEMVNKWKAWYSANRKKIKWSRKKMNQF